MVTFDDTEVAFSSKNNQQLSKIYFIFKMMNNPTLVNLGSSMIKMSLNIGLPISWMLKPIFNHFCGGEDLSKCKQTMDDLGKYKIGSILDYSVEGEKSEEGFDATMKEILSTIELSAKSSHIPFSVFKVTGIADFDLLQKIQEGKTLTEAEQYTWGEAKKRVNTICSLAKEKGTKLLIDGEETWIQDTIDNLVYDMMLKYNTEKCIIYNTYQMYRSDMLGNLKKASQIAKEKGYWLGAKLVRGAYMEKERKRAETHQYKDPIQTNKKACDADFNAALIFCVQHIAHIGLCAGSHNEYSNQYLTTLIEQHQLNKDDHRIYFAQLYGMSDQISYKLASLGYNVAKYVPYGPVKSVIPYLLRRADENTSVAGQSSREYKMIVDEKKRRKK